MGVLRNGEGRLLEPRYRLCQWQHDLSRNPDWIIVTYQQLDHPRLVRIAEEFKFDYKI
jgi:hypothetical protein